MDKLEEHIRRDREHLDIYEPSADSWAKIRSSVKRKKSPFGHWVSVAAMFIIILGSAVMLYRTLNRTDEAGKLSNDADVNHINPELKETEIYYNNVVNSLYMEATPMLTAHPEIEKELVTDISRLDSICSEIKKDLKDNIANREVVEALIQNYRIKIRLLEDMLVILKKNEGNPEKNNSYEL